MRFMPLCGFGDGFPQALGHHHEAVVAELVEDGCPAGGVGCPLGHLGAGLGLPVVRSVVASMGGEVEGSPRARGGAVFRVRLPPDAAPLERSPQPEPRLQEAEPEVRSGRILVVDDEPVMGALMRRALAGHEVYILTSARDALELLEAL